MIKEQAILLDCHEAICHLLEQETKIFAIWEYQDRQDNCTHWLASLATGLPEVMAREDYVQPLLIYWLGKWVQNVTLRVHA